LSAQPRYWRRCPGQGGSKPEDQVFEAEEPAGDPAGVFGGGGAAVEVGEPGGGEFPVAGDQVLQDGGVQGGLPGLAGGRRGAAGLHEQGGHLRGPFLVAWLEVVQALEVAQQVNLMENSP
jgi:hypothetical protein